jgi:protein TonB
LRAAWGAQIQHKVHRRLAYPRDGRGTGRVRLQLTIARDGRLDAMHIIGAEGHPSFERAARTAVTRAGRFPAAPDGLPDPRYTFLLTLNMQP